VSDQAIVFLTHVQSERVFDHFRRLRKETTGLLSTVLCIHYPNQWQSFTNRALTKIRPSTKTIPSPHIRVDVKSGVRLLPNRFSQMQKRGGWFNNGFSDLCYMPALVNEQLLRYEYVWLVENDVDYAGNWRDFFLSKMESSADLIAAYIRARVPDDDWYHWSWFRAPPEVLFAHHTQSFLAIARFSRRLLSLYVDAVRNDLWEGHTEALFPTIARYHGFTISDLAPGAFCPEQWLGTSHGCGKQFDWAPTMQRAYFHEQPMLFLERNVLYHPVKAGWERKFTRPPISGSL